MKNPFVQLLVVLGALGLFVVAPIFILPALDIPVIFPHVQMPAEKIWLEPLFTVGNIPIYLFNSFTSIMLANVLLIIMGVTAGAAARKRLQQYEANPRAVDEDGEDMMVPKGWLNTFEMIVEYFFDLVEQIVGAKWAKQVFPVVMTIFLFVLTVNWLHFLPGVDSVGIVHCAKPPFKGYEAVEMGSSGVFRLALGETLDGDEIGTTGAAIWIEDEGLTAEEAADEQYHLCEEAAELAHHGEVDEELEIRYTLAPFFRTGSTDLNMTLAVAIFAMVAVQVFGVRELGAGYFWKFFNIPGLKNGPMAYMDLVVGVLELISEFAKVLSFTLRLFGNMFAGAILLFVMMYLIPVGVPLIFFGLELLIGAIQALVFAMLTLALISVAMAGHGDHDEHDEEHH